MRPETRQVVGIGLVLMTLSGALALLVPEFRTLQNISNVLLQSSINCVLAVGMTFVILTAGIDLSVGSLLALTSAVMGVVLTRVAEPSGGTLIAAAVLGAIAAGALAGAMQGAVIVRWRVPPFICTLGMMTVARGLALVLTQQQTIHGIPLQARWLGAQQLSIWIPTSEGLSRLAVPVPVLVSLGLVAMAHVVLTQTVYGRHVMAVGANEEAARLAGVPVGPVKMSVYLLSGAAAGLAGVILTGRMGSASPIIGYGSELDAIAAVVIGGTSLFGGRGTVIGSLLGAVMMQVLRNGLTLMGKPDPIQQIVIGSVIVFAVVLDQVVQRRTRR